jgi:nitroreductase
MRAETSTPLNEIIATRRSPRSFDPDYVIPAEDIVAVLEAARWAPSAFNGQPWRFFVGHRGDQTYAQILSSLVEFNQKWAQNSSTLILVTSTTSKSDGTPHLDFQYDCGLAVAQLVIEAHDRGLVAHQMTGFNKETAQGAVEVPAELVPVVVIALGKQDAPEKLSGPLLERELAKRERLPLETIVLKGLPA